MKALALLLSALHLTWAAEPRETRFSRCNPDAGSIHQFQVGTLDGKNVSVSQYAGNVLLVINVATYWKYTEQYLDFNPLIDKNKDMGFHILAFPCNQFDLQEPGENHELLNGIKYVRPGKGFEPAPNLHLFGKLEVNGDGAHPMYKFLKDACPPTTNELGEKQYMFWKEIRGNDIVWNFEKFIVDRQGRPLYRFHPAAWQKNAFVDGYLQPVLTNLRADTPTNSASSAAASPASAQAVFPWNIVGWTVNQAFQAGDTPRA